MRKNDLHPTLRATAIPLSGHSGCFALVPPPVPSRVEVPACATLFALADRELVQLADALAAYPDAALLLAMLNRREAVDSSQIEGTRTTFSELLLYEIEQASSAQHADLDAGMTMAYVDAYLEGMAAVSAGGTSALTTALICRLHAILMHDQPNNTPGVYRTIQNRIGGYNFQQARFIPPPPERLASLMDDLARLLNFEPTSNAAPTVLMRAPIIHAQFEAIHPFIDGNGRTGRLLLPLVFAAEGYPPLHLASFLKARQSEYYDALLAVQMRLDWEPWLRLFLECVLRSCRHTVGLIAQLQTLRREWALRLAGRRKHATVHRVIELLARKPVLTVNEVVRELKISFPAANNAIEELVALDILRVRGEERRNRVFQAHHILNALNTGMDELISVPRF